MIKTKNGYVNADMIESFAVLKHEKYCDIVAYAPAYSGDSDGYNLGQTSEKYEAYQRLDRLAFWLAETKYGIFDVMLGGDDHAVD